MVTNMSVLDRAVRAIIAVLIGLLYYFSYITGVWAIVLGIVAAVFLFTAIVGFCPLYRLFGISTNNTTRPLGR
jgi:hypothetical protein